MGGGGRRGRDWGAAGAAAGHTGQAAAAACGAARPSGGRGRQQEAAAAAHAGGASAAGPGPRPGQGPGARRRRQEASRPRQGSCSGCSCQEDGRRHEATGTVWLFRCTAWGRVQRWIVLPACLHCPLCRLTLLYPQAAKAAPQQQQRRGSRGAAAAATQGGGSSLDPIEGTGDGPLPQPAAQQSPDPDPSWIKKAPPATMAGKVTSGRLPLRWVERLAPPGTGTLGSQHLSPRGAPPCFSSTPLTHLPTSGSPASAPGAAAGRRAAAR